MSTKEKKGIGILGAGAWGTALANLISENGHEVLIWAYESEVVETINNQNENVHFLSGIKLNPGIKATKEIKDLKDKEIIFVTTPSKFLRECLVNLKKYQKKDSPFVICTKGIEEKSNLFVNEVFEEIFPDNSFALLSGPTFAIEVANKSPSAATIATLDKKFWDIVSKIIGSNYFRPYFSEDIMGVAIGGSLKNVIAIASGIAEGRNLGENAQAALITRGLAEMIRFCNAKGGNPTTMMGLAGLGDLTLTCLSKKSRNTSLGIKLGEGQAIEMIISSQKTVSEGYFSAPSIIHLAKKMKIEMPICQGVNNILNNQANIDAVIIDLLSRPFKSEFNIN